MCPWTKNVCVHVCVRERLHGLGSRLGVSALVLFFEGSRICFFKVVGCRLGVGTCP
jgi:hypothetical protein